MHFAEPGRAGFTDSRQTTIDQSYLHSGAFECRLPPCFVVAQITARSRQLLG